MSQIKLGNNPLILCNPALASRSQHLNHAISKARAFDESKINRSMIIDFFWLSSKHNYVLQPAGLKINAKMSYRKGRHQKGSKVYSVWPEMIVGV